MSSGRWDDLPTEEAVRELLGRNPAASRRWRQVWRISYSVRRYQLSAVGQGGAANSGDGAPSLASCEKRSMASVCSMTTPSEASRHGRHQLTCSGSC